MAGKGLSADSNNLSSFSSLHSSLYLLSPPLCLLPSSLFPQVTELQKRSHDLKTALDESCMLAEKVVSERIGKQAYLEQDKANQNRMTRLQTEIDSIVQTL